jgi:hypothetical protein
MKRLGMSVSMLAVTVALAGCFSYTKETKVAPTRTVVETPSETTSSTTTTVTTPAP